MEISPDKIKRILIYRCGTIGDTIVSVPAINLVREHFRGAKLALMTAHDLDGKVWADDVLREFGWFDHFITYTSSDLKSPTRLLFLTNRIRAFRPDLVIELASDKNSGLRIWRDRLFFLMAGSHRFKALISEKPGFWGLLKNGDRVYPREVDRIVSGLEKIGIEDRRILFSLPIQEAHVHMVSKLIGEDLHGAPKTLIGMCPWSKQPAKRWPIERFAELGSRLIEAFDTRILIVGGEEEAGVGEVIADQWPTGRAVIVAGKLGTLETAEALRRCRMYVGNDTGSMHLAAAVGTPCVAIFAAREPPESWHPYGSGHIVLRRDVPCRNCNLSVCNKGTILCLDKITLEDVFGSCEKVLKVCAG